MLSEWTRKTKELFALVVNGDDTQDANQVGEFYEDSILTQNDRTLTIMSSNGSVQIEIEDIFTLYPDHQYAICTLSIDDAKELIVLIGKAIQDLEEN